MLRFTLAAATAVTLATGPAMAAQELYDAMVAAMGDAIEDPRYLDILDSYGLPAPDFAGDQTLVNSSDYAYPAFSDGTLLDRALKTGNLRLGWIAVGAPWSVPGDGDDPVGLSVDFWQIIQEKLNAHYGSNIELDWVEYTSAVGNNDMYKWLATDADHTCATLDTGGPENCYDIIGGAYAINARRKEISHMSPAYYPLNMSVVRTPKPLEGTDATLDNAEKILAGIEDADTQIVIAGYEDTGEHSIMNGWQAKFGDTFTMMFRTPKTNVLEYAETTDAHFVMGTNVRMAVTRFRTPEFCADCEIIPSVSVFGGVGFATALPANR